MGTSLSVACAKAAGALAPGCHSIFDQLRSHAVDGQLSVKD